jgi:P pilus assembly chaperone PapD
MVAPFSTRGRHRPRLGWTPNSVEFSVINDFSGYTKPERVSLTAAR